MNVLFLNSRPLIERHLPDIARLLGPGVAAEVRGEFTLADLADMVRSGSAFAGLAFDDAGTPVLAMVFEFRFYPRKQVVNVMALGGRNLAAVAVTFWPQFLAWAKESGACHVEACASPAMTRVLRNFGFGHVYNLLRCEI